MMKNGLILALAAACIGLGSAGAARADDTGLATALHDVRREGGKLCMSDHFHHGSSYGLPSKKAAEANAARDWTGFVAFEYGTAWANFRKAGSKKMECSQSGSGWGCSVEARPCK